MADDLSDVYAELRQLKDELRRLKNTQMLQNASVTEGRLRFIGGLLLIDSGGTLTVIGTMNGEGDFTWTGPWTLSGAGTISGDVDITGSLDVVGPWTLSGAGDITGDVELTGSMGVRGGGDITVQGGGGDVVLSSSFSSPRINIGGAQIDGGASFTFTAGGTTVYFTGGTIRIAAMPTVSTGSYPGSFPGAVVADLSGNLYRVV